MKENADKYLDNLSRKVMTKSSIESPSFNFTQTVMSQIHDLSSHRVTTYVPLISNRIWTLIASAFAVIVLYTIFMAPASESSLLKKWNLDQFQLSNFNLSNLFSNMDVSQVTVYATLFLALMLWLQIPLLKYYFNKRLD